jgi:hypothetical protein
MFKLTKERLTWIDVKWRGMDAEGHRVENVIEVQVALCDASRLLELAQMEGATDKVASFREFVRDWRGVADEAGASLPMTDDTIAQLVEVPMFINGFGDCYMDAWRGEGERRSLFAASPDAGQQAGAAPTIPAA